MKRLGIALIAAAFVGCVSTLEARAQDAAKPVEPVEKDGVKTLEGAKEENGKWVLPDGSATYHIGADGTLDWYTFSGFRRYHSECHVCHGPEGEGSTFGPALINSLKTMNYADFLAIVASGRVNVGGGKENVMPALGDNKNVMCYIEDIFVYLKARATGALPRGRPGKRADKPEAATEHEKSCLAG